MSRSRWILLCAVLALGGWQVWEWSAPRQQVYVRDERGRAMVHAWEVDEGRGARDDGSFRYYRWAGSRT
ncbi:MAG: hypothetical protein OER88_11020, partial [Planctomycetota bacterium]|nr:hypothetical protein [Planctomycetota bacterium]